ncbi:MAG: hypothetical protein JWM43_3162 [Acidobacteriaceae bacterium]|nr:hypothetical protein [Acidobacteriaceae bacterium]
MNTNTIRSSDPDTGSMGSRRHGCDLESESLMKASTGKAKRAKLVSFLRGYFVAPVIGTLGELGIAARMLEGAFSVATFDGRFDEGTLRSLFRYLHSIGLLSSSAAGEYEVIDEARTILSRNGAFSLLLSYQQYFELLPQLLQSQPVQPTVDRARNVRGSGHLHSRKFFPVAFELLKEIKPSSVIDIGCGDGCFLASAVEFWPGLGVFGVDLAETATQATELRLARRSQSARLTAIADGFDIPAWSAEYEAAIPDRSNLLISMWFVAHEFSRGSSQRIVEYFRALHRRFPQARILLGEINNIPELALAHQHDFSIMPEFLLFHALSGQGVLSWSSWQTILTQIPYSLRSERLFDVVESVDGSAFPASFLWLMEPVDR